MTRRDPDMSALFEAILQYVPPPPTEVDAPLQLQISTLDYNSYVGRIGIGRIRRGTLRAGQQRRAALRRRGSRHRQDRPGADLHRPASASPVEEAAAGDIVAITGIEDVNIGMTRLRSGSSPRVCRRSSVDEPTLAMNFQVNTSPLAGREGKFVTSRQIRERLYRELQSNVALRVEDTADADVFRVLGRGELHLTILIENMRREGYELAVGKPQVLQEDRRRRGARAVRGADGRHRRGAPGRASWRRSARAARELTDMAIDGNGRARLDYRVPARGLIGFQGEFMTLTRGTGLMSHIFDGYGAGQGRDPRPAQRRADQQRGRRGRRLCAVRRCRSAAACS